jgi:hypothetical protein
MENRLNEQVEATRAMNETLNKFIVIMGNQEAARNITPPPPVPTPLVITPLQASQPSRVKPGVPSHLTEIERRDTLSSHPVSCIFHSLNQILLTSRCTSTGHCCTSRADVWRVSPSAFYGRNSGLERCASHLGMTSLRNLRRHSAQRMRQPRCSCDLNLIGTTKANGTWRL